MFLGTNFYTITTIVLQMGGTARSCNGSYKTFKIDLRNEIKHL